MEDGDFDPFSDFAENSNIPEYLQNLSHSHSNQVYENDREEEFVELQNVHTGDNEDIPDINTESLEDQGHHLQGQYLCKKKNKELKNDDRFAAYGILMERSKNGILPRTTTTAVCQAFNIPVQSIQRLWKRGKESGNHNVASRRNNSGRSKVEIDWERVRDIPLRRRTTIRNLSKAMGVSRSRVTSSIKIGEIKRHTNTIKPMLTGANRLKRIQPSSVYAMITEDHSFGQ